jgi:hypothetical protein
VFNKKDYRDLHKEEAKNYRIRYKQLYPEKYIYSWIKQRCENPKDKRYKDYGGRGIKCLITTTEIRQLMERDGYWHLTKPSIDRKDNDGNYTFENCRFIEMKENGRRASIKPILQFSLDGQFIKEWESITEAAKTLKIQISNISHTASGRLRMTGGFIWRYK